ncbi:hypothetical protein ACWJKU_18655 [Methylocaldum sp. MU1018]
MNFRPKSRRIFRILLFALVGALTSGCGAGFNYRIGIGAGYPRYYDRYDYYPYGYFYGFGAHPYRYGRPYGYDRHFYGFDPYYRPYWDRRPYRFDEPHRHWDKRPYGSGQPFRSPRPHYYRYRR